MSYQNELYQQVILDHNKNPRNFREIEGSAHHCLGHNPLCGDKIAVFLDLDDVGVIQDISFNGSGCAISKASASLMTSFLKGKSVDEARVIFTQFHKMILGELDPEKDENLLGKLKIFVGVRDFPSRTKCATIAWHTLKCALDKEGEVVTD
ncbi:MAG: SUF system NifU family Fe-S cluster assembly protein [Nitrospinota bacterium]|nr:SUF system NifU family Fe-S cluster assembly protein [Nitrospinota bacterium]